MTRPAVTGLAALLVILAWDAAGTHAGDEVPPGLQQVLDGFDEPAATFGFYVSGTQRLEQAGRTASLPVTLAAYPLQEGERRAWMVRQVAGRATVSTVEEVVLDSAHRPIRGTARSEQGDQKQALEWWSQEGAIAFEHTDPSGRVHKGSVPLEGPVLSSGAGLVLFLRQLRPRTGTFAFSLLTADMLVRMGLVPMKLEVSLREHDGSKAYVGEARLADAVRMLVALDPDTGALRALETAVIPSRLHTRLTGITDRGVAEVHNQTAAALERQGALPQALEEAAAARQADPDESGYPLRIGSIHRKLAKQAPDTTSRVRHRLAAGLATLEAARLLGEGLRTGRLALESAASFRTMQATFFEVAGNDLLEVLASDRTAGTLVGHPRAFVEVKAAEALVGWALLTKEDPERALAFAGKVARELAQQNEARSDPAAAELAAIAGRALAKLAERAPRDAQVLEDLGAMSYMAVQDVEALRALKQCLALRPKSPRARAYYGAALFRTGRQAEAREQLAILDRVGARREAAMLRRLTGLP